MWVLKKLMIDMATTKKSELQLNQELLCYYNALPEEDRYIYEGDSSGEEGSAGVDSGGDSGEEGSGGKEGSGGEEGSGGDEHENSNTTTLNAQGEQSCFFFLLKMHCKPICSSSRWSEKQHYVRCAR